MTLSRADPSILGTAEQIAARIRAEIERGALAPGASLNQVALAARFGLSRIPVREALRQLAAEGYLSYPPNKGATVAGVLPLDESLEIIEIRECLETRLMADALPRLTPETLRNASRALTDYESAGAAEVFGAHQRFHSILFEAAERPIMAGLINGWRFRLDVRPREDRRRKQAYAVATHLVHRRLLDACRQRDARAIRRCVREEYAIARAAVESAERR